MATALITGASGGIGLELAMLHAELGGDLVLVARSGAKLEALQSELERRYPIRVHTIVSDLSQPDASMAVYEAVRQQDIIVDYLINNAGFGDFGYFSETDWQKEAQMISLNIIALTQLTKLFIGDMVLRRSGKIMNLASTASFQPGPFMSVYFATKAYVLHFSEAIAFELRSKGITVTALCPGPTESGFQAAAAMEESRLFKGKKLPTAKQVAAYGYRAMMQGKAVAIHGFRNRLIAGMVRFAPRNWVLRIVAGLQTTS